MIPEITRESLFSISPLLFLIGLASFALVWEVVFKGKARIANGFICILGVLATLMFSLGRFLLSQGEVFESFAGSTLFDSYSLFCSLIFLSAQ